jgi:LEA14-like dessication related protein
MRSWLTSFARLAFLCIFTSLVAWAVVACTKPDPPVLTPKEATVSGVTGAGVDLSAKIEAYNPNKFDLSARSVTAALTLDGKYDVGSVTIPRAVVIPAGQRVVLDVPISIKWTDLSPLLTVAANGQDVPYQLSGTVNIGGDTLNVDLPFKIGGIMTHDQIIKATLRSIPPFPLPGLPGPPPSKR